MENERFRQDLTWNEDTTISVENIGGIRECEVSVSPGVTLFAGRNTTNRTSLLSAIAGVLGGTRTWIKSDADAGRVTLSLDGKTYTREYSRQGQGLSTEGKPYTDDADIVDLFVHLDHENPIRQAIERDDDLRELLMRPIDTDWIQEKIDQLEADRDDLDQRLNELERKRTRLPELEETRGKLREKIDTVEVKLSDARETIEEYNTGKEEAERAEQSIEELEELRQSLREAREKLDHQDAELEELRNDHAEVSETLEELTVPTEELESIEREIETLEREKRAVEDRINDLTRIIEFNDDFLSNDTDMFPGEGEDVIDALDPASEQIECWTCGSRVERRDIEERLDSLRDLVAEEREERNRIVSELKEQREEYRELRRIANNKESLVDRRERLERQIDHREERREELKSKVATLREEIEALESRVEEADIPHGEDLIEAYQRVSELEYERGQLESEYEDVDSKIAAIEEEITEQEDLEARREELSDEITSLRSRIDDLEQSAVERFNEHMVELIDLLNYENIARIWVERIVKDHPDDRTFDLHIVRETDDGSVYEDSLHTLSESERDVIGLVVALVGYLVHEVHEEVPFMLIDSLESIDATRLVSLIDYLSRYAPYLLVVLLPQDAAAFDDEYDRVMADQLSQ